jgi:hypothetical protein
MCLKPLTEKGLSVSLMLRIENDSDLGQRIPIFLLNDRESKLVYKVRTYFRVTELPPKRGFDPCKD